MRSISSPQSGVIAWQIEQAMQEEEITKAEMAARMKTSRTQIDRLLDPRNNRIQLDTLQRAAQAVGRSLRLELTRPDQPGRAHRSAKRAQPRRGKKANARTSLRGPRGKRKSR